MLPSGSDDAEASAVTASGAVPEDGVTVSLATGGWFAAGDTVTVAEAVAIAPPLSVTVTLAVQVPAAYVWVAVAPGCGPTTVPSPKSNRYDAMLPSGSDDAEASAVTASGAVPDDGVTVSLATGGWFAAGDTVTVADAVAIAPPLSVTVTLAVHVPAAYVWVAVAPGCGPTTVPSPKSNR